MATSIDTQIDIRSRHGVLESFDGGVHEDIDGGLAAVSCGNIVVEIAGEAVGTVGCPVGWEAGEDESEGEGAEIGGLVDEGTAGDASASCSMRESCCTSNGLG